MNLIHLDDEGALKSRLERKDGPFVVVIGGTWCPNCKNLMNGLKGAEKDITDAVLVCFFELQDQKNLDKSYVSNGISDVIGETVMSLPCVIYFDGKKFTTGGMTMTSIAVKKINALAKAEPTPEAEDDSGEDFECESCHL